MFLLDFHGSAPIDDIILTMRNSIFHHDIKFIVLDNLQFMMGVNTKMNKFDYQDYIISKLRTFATENKVHIIIVIHPRKTDEQININSIYGSAKATQESDNVIIIQKYKEARLLEIAKNRFDGSVGKTLLAFEPRSCRFIELTNDEVLAYKDNNISVEQIPSISA